MSNVILQAPPPPPGKINLNGGPPPPPGVPKIPIHNMPNVPPPPGSLTPWFGKTLVHLIKLKSYQIQEKIS